MTSYTNSASVEISFSDNGFDLSGGARFHRYSSGCVSGSAVSSVEMFFLLENHLVITQTHHLASFSSTDWTGCGM